MIVGIGSDLCSVDRIAQSLERFGDRFIKRIFTAGECAVADARPNGRAATLAKRFAAKEACAKALGTGFRDGVFMNDIEVVQRALGAPGLVLHGGAAEQLARLIPADHVPAIHLSLTDDLPWAQAFVVIEARPA